MKKKIIIGLSSSYILFMAILACMYFIQDEQFKAIVAIGGVICGLIPLLLTLFTKFQLSPALIVSYIIFLFGTQYLGSIIGLYKNGWWDTFMHFISGALVAFLGIALYERLLHAEAKKEISPSFLFLYILSFSTLGAVLWEIYEFSGDTFFNMSLQGGGNKDTMTDLIAGTIGGLIIAAWSAYKVKYK